LFRCFRRRELPNLPPIDQTPRADFADWWAAVSRRFGHEPPTTKESLMRRLIALVSLALALSLGLAVVASAADPTFTDESAHVVQNPYIKCGTFNVVGDFSITRRITTFYDNDGTAVRRVAHISIDGTLTNSVTGASLDYMREGTFTQNLFDGSTVTNGQRTRVTAPGSGIVLQDMGRIVREGSAIVFLAGPTDFLDYQSGDSSGVQDLCAALAA
jgi:hypothetical protein